MSKYEIKISTEHLELNINNKYLTFLAMSTKCVNCFQTNEILLYRNVIVLRKGFGLTCIYLTRLYPLRMFNKIYVKYAVFTYPITVKC